MINSKIAIRHGYGTSLANVGEDIGEVLKKKYAIVDVTRNLDFSNTFGKGFTHIVLLTAIDPVFSLGQISLLNYICKKRGIKCVFYTTTEGKILADDKFKSLFNNFDVVAVSNYVKNKINEIGITVKDVVLHGVSPSKIENVLALKEAKNELHSIFKDKVIFFITMSARRRKGWDEFLQSWQLVDKEVRKNSVVLHITESSIKEKIKKLGLEKDLIELADMGNVPHWKVMLFIYSSDYLIFPSLAEGFGLPLLESMALGTPSIANKLPVFTEFAHPKTFFVEPFKIEYYRPKGEPVGGINYELYVYKPEDMAKKIEEAFYFYINKKDEYEILRKELMEYTKQYYTDKTFSWFIKWIEGEI